MNSVQDLQSLLEYSLRSKGYSPDLCFVLVKLPTHIKAHLNSPSALVAISLTRGRKSMCFYMRTLPKVSTYSLEPGRQPCCILDIQTFPLQRWDVYFTKTGLSPVSTEVCCWVLGNVLTSMAGLNFII